MTLVIFIFHGSAFSGQASNKLMNIRWMTEEYAPYNFTIKGELNGISVDILNEVWKRSGMIGPRPDIEVLPWARGYMYLQQEKNSCLFSTSITEERKKLFTFAGTISENKNVIISKKEKGFKIDKIQDLKALTIGAIREDAGEQLLLSAGWDINLLEHSSSPESLVRKLSMNRMDAISYGQDTAVYYMKKFSIDPDQYETIFLLKKTELSFAFNKETDPEIVNEFQRIMDEMKNDGTIEIIRKKYLK